MAGRSPTSVEMRTPAIVSAMVHVFVLSAAILNLDFFSRPPLMEPEPVMVEFEAIDKKAAAPTIGNPPPQPKDVPITQETTKAPPPKTADPPPAPPQPKPEAVEAKPQPPKPEEKPKAEAAKPVEDLVAMKPKEPEPPKVEKPPEPPKPPKPAEVKKPEPPKPPPPKPQPPKPDRVDSLLDDILKNKQSPTKVQTPEQQPKPPQQVTRQAPAAPNLAPVVTASEIEGVRQKIQPCWNVVGSTGKLDTIITIVVDMNPNGAPVKAELRDMARYNSDPAYRALADALYRAVMNPRCHPWPLSPEKYSGGWRSITFNFNPRDLM